MTSHCNVGMYVLPLDSLLIEQKLVFWSKQWKYFWYVVQIDKERQLDQPENQIVIDVLESGDNSFWHLIW